MVFMFNYLQIACDSLSIYQKRQENYTFVLDTYLKLTFPPQVKTVAS